MSPSLMSNHLLLKFYIIMYIQSNMDSFNSVVKLDVFEIVVFVFLINK